MKIPKLFYKIYKKYKNQLALLFRGDAIMCYMKGKDNPTQENKEFKIPIDALFLDFEERLKIEKNDRIIFSAKFGTGKTYFLNKFFEAHKDDYIKIHLHPTNYQISNNEKIMEFIKLDILINLYKVNGSEKDGPTGVALKSIKDSKLGQIAFSIGTVLPFIGDYISRIKNIIDATGIVTEENIRQEIKKLEEIKSNQKKKMVLVIDDFDRLDPDHVFRILNIFSVFVGENEDEPNLKQLGFDKIILVADFDNIKSIYHHKYGNEADFGGYFNKFFSEIFKFSNTIIVKKYIDEIIKIYKIDGHELNQGRYKGPASMVYLILKHVLLRALDSNKINLRQLFGPISLPFPEGSETDIDTSMKCLIQIFGNDKKELIETIQYNINGLKKSSQGNPIFCEGPSWRVIYDTLARLLGHSGSGELRGIFIKDYEVIFSPGRMGVKYIKEPEKSVNYERLFFEVLREYINRYY